MIWNPFVALSEAYPPAGVNAPQYIYSNFRSLVVALHEAAAADLKIIKKMTGKMRLKGKRMMSLLRRN